MNARVLGAALLAVTLSAGCSEEAEVPRSLPAVSAAPSPVASALPSVPPSAQAQTPQAAAAFARFFYAEVERAYREKDPAIVARLSAPGCSACDRFVKSLTALRDEGETVTPVSYDIIAAEAPGFSGPEARVDVIYNSPEITRRDRAGKVIATEPDVKNFQEQLTLTRAGNEWLVKAVTVV